MRFTCFKNSPSLCFGILVLRVKKVVLFRPVNGKQYVAHGMEMEFFGMDLRKFPKLSG